MGEGSKPSWTDKARHEGNVVTPDFVGHAAAHARSDVSATIVQREFRTTPELQKRAIDGQVILALNSHHWYDGAHHPSGKAKRCVVDFKQLGISVEQFSQSTWRLFGRAGFDCHEIMISQFTPTMIEVIVPTAAFTAHQDAFIALFYEAKARQENGAHYR